MGVQNYVTDLLVACSPPDLGSCLFPALQTGQHHPGPPLRQPPRRLQPYAPVGPRHHGNLAREIGPTAAPAAALQPALQQEKEGRCKRCKSGEARRRRDPWGQGDQPPVETGGERVVCCHVRKTGWGSRAELAQNNKMTRGRSLECPIGVGLSLGGRRFSHSISDWNYHQDILLHLRGFIHSRCTVVHVDMHRQVASNSIHLLGYPDNILRGYMQLLPPAQAGSYPSVGISLLPSSSCRGCSHAHP